MKVKLATAFYNKELLRKISKGEADRVRLGYDLVKDLSKGDLIKFIGDEVSLLVTIVNVEPKDCNRYCLTTVKVQKVLQGEFEIEYDLVIK